MGVKTGSVGLGQGRRLRSERLFAQHWTVGAPEFVGVGMAPGERCRERASLLADA